MKFAAMLLGTAGVGLVGLLQTLIGTGTAFGGLGINQSSTRQVAAAKAAGPAQESAARRALFLATSALAISTTLLVWLLREPIAADLLAGSASSESVGWMSIGIGLTIAAGSQSSLLAGLGRVGDVARVSIVTAALSTAAAIGSLLALGEQAIVPYLLAVPVASVIAGWFYVARAPAAAAARPGRSELVNQLRGLLSLGAAVMVSAIIMNVSQLAVRSLIGARLGLAELGLFQATVTISITYLTFVLQGMSADYYPRLSALDAASEDAHRVINEQTEVALLLGGPVIIAMMGLAGFVLSLLYSGEFAAAAPILRWQMLGDVLRLASWPLGFALLAAGRGRIFVLLELVAMIVYVGLTLLLLSSFGVESAGMAYVAMYVVYLPLVFIAVRSSTGFRWRKGVARDFLLLFSAASGVILLASRGSGPAAIAGSLAALLLAAFAVRRLRGVLPRSRSTLVGPR